MLLLNLVKPCLLLISYEGMVRTSDLRTICLIRVASLGPAFGRPSFGESQENMALMLQVSKF